MSGRRVIAAGAQVLHDAAMQALSPGGSQHGPLIPYPCPKGHSAAPNDGKAAAVGSEGPVRDALCGMDRNDQTSAEVMP